MPTFLQILDIEQPIKSTISNEPYTICVLPNLHHPFQLTPAIMTGAAFLDKVSTFLDTCPNALKIAVQVPDSMLSNTVDILSLLADRFPSVFFFVVADSSFNDCCVDFISAQHLEADAIIHFGPYCHREYDVPICFLSGLEEPLASEYFEIEEKVESFIQNTNAQSVIVFLDQVDSILVDRINTNLEAFPQKEIIFASPNHPEHHENFLNLFEFYISKNVSIPESAIIYIGPHSKISTDLGCIFYHHESLRISSRCLKAFDSIIPRELTKGLGAIDSISFKDQVGILVENPNIKQHIQLAQALQTICLANEIFANILYIGRLNEMKLGNFADIQFFIHLSCAGKACFTFSRPVVTPFEFICSKFDVGFWEHQHLRDYKLLFEFLKSNRDMFLTESFKEEDLEDSNHSLIAMNFNAISNVIASNRKGFSFNGLDIDLGNKELKLHLGATGNSVAYDYEK